jgi:calcineurin-like phosphoesterase family protein
MKITLKNSQRLWFTSDTHYSHVNICRGISKWEPNRGQRDFETLEEMNDTLVNGINTLVDKNDILIHLGDFSFGGREKVDEFRGRLNCDTLYLVVGNHDHHIKKDKELQALFIRTTPLMDLSVNGKSFVLCHFPLCTWAGVGSGVINLHGHTHKKPERRFGKGLQLDIGVDGNEMTPYEVNEIISLMKDRPIGHYLEDDYHLTKDL